MVIAVAYGIPLASFNPFPRLRVKQVVIYKVVFDIDPLVTDPDCSSTDTTIDTLDIVLDGHIVEPVEFKLMLGFLIFHFILLLRL